MATLNIRNLPDDIHAELRVRAAKAGRSMEAEARIILANTCKPATQPQNYEKLQSLVDRLYADKKPSHVVDDLIAERRKEAIRE